MGDGDGDDRKFLGACYYLRQKSILYRASHPILLGFIM